MPAAGKKVLYTLVGLVATALGFVGVWLPGMPTTVFVLIALWAFSNSSPRLHSWLLKVPILKSGIKEAQRFQHEGTIDNRVKFISQACSWISFIGVTITFRSIVISLIVGALALSCSIFMYLVPTAHAERTED
ncbi:MAG: YbaN family protein [Candidatus Saccharimonadales bacterium]